MTWQGWNRKLLCAQRPEGSPIQSQRTVSKVSWEIGWAWRTWKKNLARDFQIVWKVRFVMLCLFVSDWYFDGGVYKAVPRFGPVFRYATSRTGLWTLKINIWSSKNSTRLNSLNFTYGHLPSWLFLDTCLLWFSHKHFGGMWNSGCLIKWFCSLNSMKPMCHLTFAQDYKDGCCQQFPRHLSV